MGKRIFIILVVALIGMLILPALASATLVNEYGMHFAGQSKCLDCHSMMRGDLKVTSALHGKFATTGINPAPSSHWSMFRAAGNPAQVAGTNGAMWNAGGTYDFTLPWVTLGDSAGNSATEYIFFNGSKDPTVMPWNLVEGLAWEPTGEWMIAAEEPDTGLYDVTYSCQRCHMLGTTLPRARPARPSRTLPRPPPSPPPPRCSGHVTSPRRSTTS